MATQTKCIQDGSGAILYELCRLGASVLGEGLPPNSAAARPLPFSSRGGRQLRLCGRLFLVCCFYFLFYFLVTRGVSKPWGS